MDTDSFIIYIETEDVYTNIAKDVKTRFNTSNYEVERPLLIVKYKVIVLVKDELGGKIMTKFAGLVVYAKVYAHLKDNNTEEKSA